MTQLPTALASLAFLLGQHSGEEQVHETQWTAAGTATASTVAWISAGGHAIVQEYTQTSAAGVVSFAMLSVFMTDPQTDEILLYGFDSAGYPPEPARGRYVNDTVVLSRTTPRGESRVTIVSETGNTWSQHREFRPVDGQWQPLLTGRMHPRLEPASTLK